MILQCECPPPSMLQIFWDFQERSLFTDIVLVCRQGQLRAHRLLLSLCLPFLPTDCESIILPSVDLDPLQRGLKRFYLSLNPDRLSEAWGFPKNPDTSSVDDDALHHIHTSLHQTGRDKTELDVNNETYSCEEAPGECSSEQLIDAKPVLLGCSRCQQQFSDNLQLDSHLDICQLESRSHICTVCNKRFRSRTGLTRHSREHPRLLHRCRNCGHHFATRDQLASHSTACHAIKKREKYPCEVCGKEVSTRALLQRHYKTVHLKPLSFQCDYCTYASNTRQGLNNHVDSSHLGIRHECPECGDFFSSKSSLSIHSKVHSSDRPFACLECGETFKWKKNLEAHVDNKHSRATYSCPACSKVFKSHQSLEYHAKSHDVDRQHPCHICGKHFVTKTKLRMHTNIHTGTKPYQCPNVACGKAYYSSDQLCHHRKLCEKSRKLKGGSEMERVKVFSLVTLEFSPDDQLL